MTFALGYDSRVSVRVMVTPRASAARGGSYVISGFRMGVFLGGAKKRFILPASGSRRVVRSSSCCGELISRNFTRQGKALSYFCEKCFLAVPFPPDSWSPNEEVSLVDWIECALHDFPLDPLSLRIQASLVSDRMLEAMSALRTCHSYSDAGRVSSVLSLPVE